LVFNPRLAQLERDNKNLVLENDALKKRGKQPEIKRVEIMVFKPSDVERLEKIAGVFANSGNQALASVKMLNSLVTDAKKINDDAAMTKIQPRPFETPSPKWTGVPVVVMNSESDDGNTKKTAIGELAILKICAQYPQGANRKQISILSGYTIKTTGAYINRLQRSGWVEVSGVNVKITQSGLEHLGVDYDPLPTNPQELQDYWIRKLPDGEGKLLKLMILAYPNRVSRSGLSSDTGFTIKTTGAYINRLQRRLLVDVSGEFVSASQVLFGG